MIKLHRDCEDLPLREYETGDVIIEEGGRSGALLFLKEGTVKLRRGGIDLAEISEPGAVFGEVSVLLDRPSLVRVEAVGPAVFYVADDVEGFLLAHPEVNLFITRWVARKVDAMSCYLVDLKEQYGDAEGHLGMVHEILDALMHSKH